jgi:hypothetical protein
MITLQDMDREQEKGESVYQARYEQGLELLETYNQKLIDNGAFFYNQADSFDTREFGQRFIEIALMLKAGQADAAKDKADDLIYDICDQYARG